MPELPEWITISLAERSGDSLFVALWLDAGVADQLKVSGGVAPEDMHVTLHYGGSLDELGDLGVARATTFIEQALFWKEPVEGTISGYGRFNASETSDAKDVFYASVDIPKLADLRHCVTRALNQAGVMTDEKHGFTPHVTLAYLDPGDPNPVDEIPSIPVRFEKVTLVAGSRRVTVPMAPPPGEVSGIMPMDYSEKTGGKIIPLSTPDPGAQEVRPLLFSFDQEWISFLPKPGKYFHTMYGNLDLTEQKYEALLKNFQDRVYKQDLPIVIEHDSRAAGAVGWIKDMRLGEDGSIEVKPEWNERGQQLIEGDRFRYVSAEFVNRWQDPVSGEWYNDVAVGLAICTRPHFKTDVLKPLAASEEEALKELIRFSEESDDPTPPADEESADPPVEPVPSEEPESPTTPEEEETDMGDKTPATSTTPAPEVTPDPTDAVSFTDRPVGSVVDPSGIIDLAALTEERARNRQVFADLSTRVDLAERRATDAEAKASRLEKERRTEKFTAEVLGRSEGNGLRWLGEVERHVEHLVSLAEKFGDDSPQVQYVIEEQRSKRKAVEQSGLFRDVAITVVSDTADTLSEVQVLASQYRAADPKLTEEAAVAKVFSENPKLYDRYVHAGN